MDGPEGAQSAHEFELLEGLLVRDRHLDLALRRRLRPLAVDAVLFPDRRERHFGAEQILLRRVMARVHVVDGGDLEFAADHFGLLLCDARGPGERGIQ